VPISGHALSRLRSFRHHRAKQSRFPITWKESLNHGQVLLWMECGFMDLWFLVLLVSLDLWCWFTLMTSFYKSNLTIWPWFACIQHYKCQIGSFQARKRLVPISGHALSRLRSFRHHRAKQSRFPTIWKESPNIGQVLLLIGMWAYGLVTLVY